MSVYLEYCKASATFMICDPGNYKRCPKAADFANTTHRIMQDKDFESVTKPNFMFVDKVCSEYGTSAIELSTEYNPKYSDYGLWKNLVREIITRLLYEYDIRETILYINNVGQLISQN